MNSEEQKEKKQILDWIGIVAIIIMIVGCYLLYHEQQVCKNPFKNMVDGFLNDEGIEYSYVTISIYKNNTDAYPIKSFDLIGSKYFASRDPDYFNRSEFENIEFIQE